MNAIAQDLIQTEMSLGAHNYKPIDVMLSRGEGVWLWDIDGNRYLDCLSAYSAVNQGHCHPRILEAMVEQAKRLTLTSPLPADMVKLVGELRRDRFVDAPNVAGAEIDLGEMIGDQEED